MNFFRKPIKLDYAKRMTETTEKPSGEVNTRTIDERMTVEGDPDDCIKAVQQIKKNATLPQIQQIISDERLLPEKRDMG